MKVIHISNTDSGGAIELHAAMLENGLESYMLVAKHDLGYVGNIYQISYLGKIKSLLSNLSSKYILFNLDRERGMYSYPFCGSSIAKNRFVRSADVIYLHFIAHSSFISLGEIKRILKIGKPVIFVTHDIWPITGGCHVYIDCKKFRTFCNKCPLFKSKGVIDFAALQFQKKYRIYNKFNNLYFLAISKWNLDELKASKLTALKNNLLIHICINTNIFDINNKITSRKIFGLPANTTILGFGARDLNNPFKGINYLYEALTILKRDYDLDFHLVSYGRFEHGMNRKYDFNITHLGQLKDRYSMALFYNAIDLFIMPSLAETFGMAAAESLACGTPVVCFKVGGLIDIVDHMQTVYLAKPQDSADLAKGIELFINYKDNREVAKKCRLNARLKFSRSIIFEKHYTMLTNILEGKAPN